MSLLFERLTKVLSAHIEAKAGFQMANSDEEQIAQPDEDEGIDFTDIPKITDFSSAKRVRDYGTAAGVMRVLYQEKLDRAAKVAAEQNGTVNTSQKTP